MRAFRDTGGRTWEIRIDYSTIRRVHAECQIDLTKLFDRESDAAKAVQIAPLFFGVLCALIRPELESRNISELEFGKSLDEAAGEAAVVALHEGLIDFFPESKRRVIGPAFHKVMTATEKIQKAALDQVEKTLESVDFEKAVKTAMDGKGSAGDSQPSQESHPKEGPSASSA